MRTVVQTAAAVTLRQSEKSINENQPFHRWVDRSLFSESKPHQSFSNLENHFKAQSRNIQLDHDDEANTSDVCEDWHRLKETLLINTCVMAIHTNGLIWKRSVKDGYQKVLDPSWSDYRHDKERLLGEDTLLIRWQELFSLSSSWNVYENIDCHASTNIKAVLPHDCCHCSLLDLNIHVCFNRKSHSLWKPSMVVKMA